MGYRIFKAEDCSGPSPSRSVTFAFFFYASRAKVYLQMGFQSQASRFVRFCSVAR